MEKKIQESKALERKRWKLRWVANVDKDDDAAKMRGHIVGPPKAEDQFSAEELDEMGVVGIYVWVRKNKTNQ